jgi:hypothetical protein
VRVRNRNAKLRKEIRSGSAPSAARNAARQELIQIQKRIVARLEDEIEESIGRVSPAVALYYEEYWKEVDGFERISSKEELFEACAAADIVYCGDYHTLRQSQQTARKLIEELARRRANVTVALEMVSIEHQAALDQYLEGALDEEAFLKAVDYGNTWDFQWPPYREILDLCRARGLRAVALNSDPAASSAHVLDRDFAAATVIVREARARPDAVIFVLDGDLHVSRDHLPLIVRSLLQERRLARRAVVVHQNAEPIYWKLAEEGLERVVDVVKIADGCFCVLSATPLVKLQSYLNWEQNHQELCGFTHPAWRAAEGGPDHTEQLHELVETIASFLEIKEAGLDDFIVYTTGDLDFLDALARDARFKPREIAEIRRQIEASESYFIPRANIIYLADFSLHCAAEEAAHFINTICAGFDGARRDGRDAFFYNALKEALGFFGSRIIDHRRYCMSEADFREFLKANRRKRLDPPRKTLREVARHVLAHREAERRAFATGRRAPAGAIYRLPPALGSAVAHALGYIVGDKLYNALLAGKVTKKEVRALFYDPLPPGAAEGRYFALVERLHDVDHGVPLERERL